ncbi:MAG: PEP/pyruvate-binding domain-containing protein, partial [Pseudomonadota bacterium]
GRRIIYLRFGQQPPLVKGDDTVEVVTIDARDGFESFTSAVWHQIAEHGRGAFYLFDCLSDLLRDWATDRMVGNFFRVICPFLYQLDTVAWFALHPEHHSRVTLDRIRQTTQVMIDVCHSGDDVQIQPVKVTQRHTPTMFLPHREIADRFEPVIDSSDAARLQPCRTEPRLTRQPLLDYWDRLFMEAGSALDRGDQSRIASIQEQVLQVMISREPRILALARQYLDLPDLLGIRQRMVSSGYIGGKAVGMLIARAILQEHTGPRSMRQEPHDSSHLGSDAYYAFLVHNGLWPAFMRQRTTQGYLQEAPALRQSILQGHFPPETLADLERLLEYYGQYPLLIRSSSLLEDGFGNAFAGKYDSFFLTNQGSPEDRLSALEEAIRRVYASSMSRDALQYRLQRGLDQLEEPMALLIQRVNGRFHGRYYMPDAAGVAVSRNTFTWDPDMDPAAGMVRLVMGLGTRAVDRIEDDHAAVIALDHPGRQPFRNRDEAYRFSQHRVDVLDVSDGGLTTVPLAQLCESVHSLPLTHLAETDRDASARARELGLATPVWRLTFRPLIQHSRFIPELRDMLQTLESAYAHPVDVEFTLHLDENGQPGFNLVQCRPLATLGDTLPVKVPEQVPPEQLLFATRGHFMGGNINMVIDRVIRINASAYARLGQRQRHDIAVEVGIRVRACPDGASIMLIGPGRWGTSSPELGVPVRFADIAGIAALVEVAENAGAMVPDLSYGSHFFQDLVEVGIAYVALFPEERDCDYHPDILDSAADDDEVILETDLTDRPLQLLADVVAQRVLCHFPPS